MTLPPIFFHLNPLESHFNLRNYLRFNDEFMIKINLKKLEEPIFYIVNIKNEHKKLFLFKVRNRTCNAEMNHLQHT